MLIPMILSGGAGNRLWPLSRQAVPKQFLPLIGEQTLLQQTASRCQQLGELHILCSSSQQSLAKQQLADIDCPAKFIIEPCARNTAPAIAAASLLVAEDAVLCIMPADHLLPATELFQQSVQQAYALAQEGYLVSLGVPASKPETGYGYIELGEALPNGGFKVKRFTEKPDLSTAQGFVATGNYFWNSGIFVFPVQRLRQELATHAPDLWQWAQQAVADASGNVMVLNKQFAKCPAISIDYAVMEQTAYAATVPLATTWCDIGSFAALWQVSPQDDAGNVCLGDVLTHNSQGNYIRAESRLVSTVGVRDHIIVENGDSVLVMAKGASQDVRHIVSSLKQDDRVEAVNHQIQQCDFGSLQQLNANEQLCVEQLSLRPDGVFELDATSMTVVAGDVEFNGASLSAGMNVSHAQGKLQNKTANDATVILVKVKL